MSFLVIPYGPCPFKPVSYPSRWARRFRTSGRLCENVWPRKRPSILNKVYACIINVIDPSVGLQISFVELVKVISSFAVWITSMSPQHFIKINLYTTTHFEILYESVRTLISKNSPAIKFGVKLPMHWRSKRTTTWKHLLPWILFLWFWAIIDAIMAWHCLAPLRFSAKLIHFRESLRSFLASPPDDVLSSPSKPSDLTMVCNCKSQLCLCQPRLCALSTEERVDGFSISTSTELAERLGLLGKRYHYSLLFDSPFIASRYTRFICPLTSQEQEELRLSTSSSFLLILSLNPPSIPPSIAGVDSSLLPPFLLLPMSMLRNLLYLES